MKISPGRLSLPAIAFLTVASTALGHPGHDGHELTWDLGHLAEHPVATMACAAVAGAAFAIVFSAFRRRTDDRNQSLRASQRSRGK